MKFRNKLVFKITLTIMIPVVLISIIISVLLYRDITKNTEVEFTYYLEQVVFNYVDYIDNSLNSVSENAILDAMLIESFDNLSAHDLISITNNNIVSDSLIFGSGVFFDKKMSSFNSDLAYFYSYRKGNEIVELIVDDNNDNIDYNYIKNNPEWWETPSTSHKGGWTKPYSDTLSGSPSMITYFEPFFFNQVFAGVVTIDISLEKFEKWLKTNEKILEANINPITFMVSEDSIIILSDMPERIGMKVFETRGQKGRFNLKQSVEVVSKAIAGETGKNIVFTEDGKDKIIAFYTPLHSTQWSAISMIPYDLITQNVKKNIGRLLLLISLFNIVLIIVIIFIARYISKPIVKLSNISLKIAEGNYATKININSNDEIGVLANNFKLMKTNLKAREEEISEANKKLLTLDEAKNQFLMLISHEIRTPLNGIVGSAYFLNDMIDDPELKEFLDMLKESVDRLDKFSQTALEITQMQTMGNDIKRKPIDYKKLIQDIVKSNIANANEKQLTISEIHTDDCEISCVEDYFKKSIEELISNAIKFSNEGTEIKISTYVENDKLKISIADTGEIIPKEKIGDIIKPFGLGKDHYDKNVGLGLTYIQTFLDIHDGSMEIQSNVGETKITLVLNLN